MIKKIRYQFVLVTMALLTAIFSILFLANTISDRYWYKLEVVQLLENLSENHAFRNITLLDEEAEYYPGIYTAVFDQNGTLDALKTYGKQKESREKIAYLARQIYEKHDDNGDLDCYIYIAKSENGGRFIAFANPRAKRHFGEVMGTIALIVVGFFSLLGISFFLSRFVTKPAQTALEREKQFISDASHELKTPVAAIILNAQAMPDVSNSKHMKNILSEASRMNRLIHRLLTLACADESEHVLKKQSFSLSENCEEILLSLESLAFENGIDFDYTVEEDISYNGSCEDIKQLVSILLDNAFKYTPRNGTVRFSLKKHGTHPVFTVYNTGSGISEEDLPHIFERFYCCESSRTSESFGLGLSIAKAIVTAHGGKITAASKFGMYTEFTVSL